MRMLFFVALLALPACPHIVVTDPWDKEMAVAKRAKAGVPQSVESVSLSSGSAMASRGSGGASSPGGEAGGTRGPLLAQAGGDGTKADAVANAGPEARVAALPARKGAEAELARTTLQEALAAGPQRFMAKLLLDPFFIEGRFIGFRLMRFFEGDARFSTVDLRRGDVVTRVNDLPIGRPHQFMRAWDDLRTADEIRVEYLRGAEKRVLRVKLTGEASKTPFPAGGGPVDE